MFARVTQFRIPSGKLGAFTAAIDSLLPAARKQAGLRALLVLRVEAGEASDVQVISVWETLADLRASEESMFYYEAVARVIAFSEGVPLMQQCQVLLSDFVPR